MSAAKHTPGPWSVNDRRDSGVMNNGVYVMADRNFVRVFNEWGDDEMQLANARLIAAAPELLEALKAAVDEVDGTFPFAFLEAARSAIAKATGGQQ